MIQVIAWSMFDAKQSPAPILVYCHFDLWNNLHQNLNPNIATFFQESMIENVCKMLFVKGLLNMIMHEGREVHMCQVLKVWLSCYLVLLSTDSKTR